jgi:hypothetical protein
MDPLAKNLRHCAAVYGETEALRQEADPVAAAMDKAPKDLRRLKEKVGGRNKLAKAGRRQFPDEVIPSGRGCSASPDLISVAC